MPPNPAKAAQNPPAAHLLAVAPKVLAALRLSYSLPYRSLSLLCGASALQVDKAGHFETAQIGALVGLCERDNRKALTNLVAAGYIERVGGHQFFSGQRWALTPSGWLLVKDASQRVAGFLSPLSISQ